MDGYFLPKDIDELFNSGETQWYVIDHDPYMDMDNVRSLEFFLDAVGISEDDCVVTEDTQVILKHNGRYMCVDSGGLGDFFSHSFDVHEVFYHKDIDSYEDAKKEV